MADWPVYAKIDGPIVLVGFGSFGKGVLPLIERHFEYDKSKFVVIDPSDKDRHLLDERGIRFIQEAMTGLPFDPLVIVLIMMGVLIVLGMFMDWIGILLLTMPIFVPIIVDLGYDPIWFGILFCMNMQISYLSPPFGPAAFYLKSVAPPEISLQEIFGALWPFMLMQMTAILLVMIFPQIALWLPAVLQPG